MSSAACAKCLRPQSELGSPLKQCSRCRQAKYCSAECQRADWPQHKRGCVSVNTASHNSAGVRATCRLQMFGSGSLENETIFYVRKTLAHLNDITVAGPFYPRQTVVNQIKGYLHNTSAAGMSLVEDMSTDEKTLRQLRHINAPLDTDPAKFMFIEILEQHNPGMVAHLPGSSFSVIATEPLLTSRTSSRVTSEHPEVKSMEIHGCFTQQNEAVARAREVINEIKTGCKNFQGRPVSQGGHAVYAYVGGGIGPDGQLKSVIVEVRHDSGQTRPM